MALSTPLSTPRPVPLFLSEPEVLSTKKDRDKRQRIVREITEPARSAPPVSRVIPQRNRLILSPNVQAKIKALNVYKIGSIENLNKTKSILSENFTVLSKLGSGSFGEVYKVRSKEDGQLYAIKRTIDSFKGNSDRKLKMSEVIKYRKIPVHPNCVKFYTAWEENRHFFIQTELCHASLDKYVSQLDCIPESDLCCWLIDLLKALHHLHRHFLVHMDVKPDNVFIGQDGICKLGDYGIMYDLSTDKEKDAQEGDCRYLAPEVMKGVFNTPADVFSLGMTILELAGDLDLPNGGEVWHELRSGKIPSRFIEAYSQEFRSIIELMLDPNPNSRWTAEKLLAHPFLNKMAIDRQKPLNELNDSYEINAECLRSPSAPASFSSDEEFPVQDSKICRTTPSGGFRLKNTFDNDNEDHALVRNLLDEFSSVDE
ncbi:unnamed protein product [Dimorphilus gyrociliatus]|uniref:non-specific serine/threonine protein kinase n=1 Tax=Dimorphilus gyrociliatus TaxID=2664684 RepID=A0A7I8W3P3_9ANNE|nr:unnamed protein product [Dimorphilus gyrociliatus]